MSTVYGYRVPAHVRVTLPVSLVHSRRLLVMGAIVEQVFACHHLGTTAVCQDTEPEIGILLARTVWSVPLPVPTKTSPVVFTKETTGRNLVPQQPFLRCILMWPGVWLSSQSILGVHELDTGVSYAQCAITVQDRN